MEHVYSLGFYTFYFLVTCLKAAGWAGPCTNDVHSTFLLHDQKPIILWSLFNKRKYDTRSGNDMLYQNNFFIHLLRMLAIN